MKWYSLPILFSSLVSLSFAQEKSEVEFAEEISTEFSVPAIPALDYISSDPSDISRPSNVKKLAAGLYNGIDENGKVKQGLALEARVFDYIPINISLEDYRESQLKYMLYNLQLSLGTIATSGDSTSTDLGWGLRLTVFDNSDPMKNKSYISEYTQALRNCSPKSPDTPMTEEELSECLANQDRPIKDEFDKQQWNASWMTIAYAGGSRLKGSEIDEGKTIGHQVWLSGGLKLKNWGQISYLAKWSEEYQSDVEEKLEELEIGSKFLVGNKSYNLFAEASYNPLLNKDDFDMESMIDTNNEFSWTLGVEFKIYDGVWAVTGLGEEAERIVGSSGIQFLSGIRLGISDKSRLIK